MGNKKNKKENKTETGINLAISNIKKKFGNNAINKVDGDWDSTGIKTITSGSIALDAAMGIGGYPRGRITEIIGAEAGGKSTLALQAIASVQEDKGVAALVEPEHAFDSTYAAGIGVNVNDLFVSQPDYGEQGLDIVEELVRSNGIDIIVVDSVAALTPKDEIDGDMSKSLPGLQARMMSKACRKLAAIVSKTNTSLIFINQIRKKIGLRFGNPEVTTGGEALKFYSTIRIDVRRIGSIGDKETSTGNRVRARIIKNKVAPPFRTAEFNILFGVGIDQIADLVEMGVISGVIGKSGTWYNYGKTRLGQGIDGCREILAEGELFYEIKDKVVKKWI